MKTLIYKNMKPKIFTSFLALVTVPAPAGAVASNGPVSYLIGGIVALLILCYLVYTLLRPEEF